MEAGRHGHGGWGPGEHRGPRARRGDVRTALLILLAEEPRNGYQLMQEIERRSDGAWRPSPGSVYPALQQLEDERLVATAEHDGNRVFEITDAGRTWVAERESETAPWDAVKDEVGAGPRQVMQLIRELAMAATQIVRATKYPITSRGGKGYAILQRGSLDGIIPHEVHPIPPVEQVEQ